MSIWLATEITKHRVTLDFSSSEQPNPTVTQLVVDEALFANAVELTSWDEDRVQLLVCGQCGIVHCQPGGWVVPRKAGELVAFVPLFEAMLEDEEGRSEYAPPPFVVDRGVVTFPPGLYQSLQRVCEGLPDADDLEALSGEELIRSVQLNAPWRVLGRFPEPVQLRRDAIVAASDGDPQKLTDMLRKTVQDLMEAPAVRIVEADASLEPIVFYLEGPAAPEWSGWMRGHEDELVLSPVTGWVVEHD